MIKNSWSSNYKKNNIKNTSNFSQYKKEKILNYLNLKNINNNFLLFYLALFVFFLVWIFSGFFTVDTDEEGIIMRFGKYNREVKPGLNYKLPNPIESVEKVSVTRIKKDIIGKISNPIEFSKGSNFSYNNDYQQSEKDLSYPKESQMLTGDENIIDMHFYIQWKIGSARSYLFNIKDTQSQNIVKSAAESIMRQIISEVTLSEALSEKRLLIERGVKKSLQSMMNSYSSGIDIISVGILYSYVGPEVRDAYRDVQSAKADRERFINQAQAFRNEIIPKAKGEAATLVEKALAYKESIILKAYGDTNKFNEIYKAYLAGEYITKKRMYLDTMESVYRNTNKIVIDKEISKGMIQVLPLDKINDK